MIPLIRNADEPPPGITAFASGRTITVAPFRYCTIKLTDCHDGVIEHLAVRTGSPLQLSLPKTISDAPWRLVSVFDGPHGESIARQTFYAKGEGTAVTVRSTENPPMQLAGIEIQLPSAVVDKAGMPYARGIWSIKTD